MLGFAQRNPAPSYECEPMDRTWKIYGILVVLGGLLFGNPTGFSNAGSPSEPTTAAVLSAPSAGPAPHGATPPPDRPWQRVAKDPLQKAKDLLAAIQQHEGNALPGYVGGGVFQNRERRLPRGDYREYDVNPKVRGRPRDAERIVIEQYTGTAYYTSDHYRTFIPLTERPWPQNRH
jgi:ribonuclease T1